MELKNYMCMTKIKRTFASIVDHLLYYWWETHYSLDSRSISTTSMREPATKAIKLNIEGKNAPPPEINICLVGSLPLSQWREAIEPV